MQTIADVMNLEVAVAAGDQPVALGAAMFAATAAGLYRQVEEAQQAMSAGTEAVYHPDPVRAKRYDRLYKDYLALGSFVEREVKGRRVSVREGQSRVGVPLGGEEWSQRRNEGGATYERCMSTQDVWFVTGSQELYGQETCWTRSRSTPCEIAARVSTRPAAGPRGVQADAHGAGRDLGDVPGKPTRRRRASA